MFIERTPRLDVHHLHHAHALSPGRYTTWQCHFQATVTANLITVRICAEPGQIVCSINDGPEITVPIVRIPATHDRDWPLFVCDCGACRRHLYIQANRLACRECLGLVYASQTHRWNSKLHRTFKLRARLMHSPMRDRKRKATLAELAACEVEAAFRARAWLRWFTNQGRKP
jgi:hypothetical protein